MGQKSKHVEGFSLPPEHHIFNPADQSADKSPCRPCNAAKHYIAAWNILDKPSGSENIRGLEEPPVRRSDDSPLPRKGGDKLASLLADLLGFPNADRQLEAKSHRLNLYESMSPSLGNELKSAPTGARTPASHDSGADNRGAVIYENCLKCRGEHCRPPPRVPPAAERPSGKVPASRPPTNGSRPSAGEEPDGGTAAGEGKRPLLQCSPRLPAKLLRSLWRPFAPPTSRKWTSSLFPLRHQ